MSPHPMPMAPGLAYFSAELLDENGSWIGYCVMDALQGRQVTRIPFHRKDMETERFVTHFDTEPARLEAAELARTLNFGTGPKAERARRRIRP